MTAFSKFNIEQKLSGQPPRTNFNVCQIDGSHNIRIAAVEGRFPWHYHTNGDEGWLIWSGQLRIDIKDRESITLRPGEGVMIPKGHPHSPVAEAENTIVVVFNTRDFKHVFLDEEPDLGGFAEIDDY